jgi:hypothetical protein
MSTSPRTVFKYEGVNEHSLQNLKARSIHFGSPVHFNDPYDCTITARVIDPTAEDLEVMRRTYVERAKDYPKIQSQFELYSQDELRQFLVRVSVGTFQRDKERFLNEKGVACFSERNDDLLMWGHYGGRYRGYCLEFRTDYQPFTKLRKVRYVASIPTIDLVPFVVARDAEQILDLYCTKSSVWGYEKEWRAIHNKAGTRFGYSRYALKAVYFGPSIDSDARESVRDALRIAMLDASCWQGKKSESEFKIEFEQLE